MTKNKLFNGLKVSLALSAFFIIPDSFAQLFDYNWSNPAGSTLAEYANAVAVDSDGNVFTTGRFQGTVDFDPGAGVANVTSNGSEDVFITKFDASGNYVWVKRVGSIASDLGMSICVDSNNDILIAGSFLNTTDFDPGAGVFNITPVVNSDAFILKLDNNGNFIWAKSVGGGNTQTILSVSTDGNDNVLFAGYASGNTDLDPGTGVVTFTAVGGNDAFIGKLNSSGDYVWSQTLAGIGNDIPYTIRTNSLNEVMVVGHFQNNPDFDPGAGTFTITSAGAEDAFIWKLDENGAFIYAKSFGGTGVDVARGLTIDASDMPYICGYFSNTADLDPSSTNVLNYTSAGSGDCFVIKLNASGNALWISAFGQTGNDYALSCDFNPISHELYTTGRFYNTVDFDVSTATFNLTSAGDADIFVQRLGENGEFISTYQMGGSDADLGFGIHASSDVILAGQFGTTADFDPSASTANETSVGLGDIFVASYNVCELPAPINLVSGPATVCSGSAELYAISPSAGAIDYTWTAPSGWTGTSTSTNITFTPSDVSGTISVTANNACGSTAAATLYVDAYLTPTVNTYGDVTLCEGDTVILEAYSDAGVINWYAEPTAINLIGTGYWVETGPVSSDTVFYVQGDNNGCLSNTVGIQNIFVNPMPNLAVTSFEGTFTAVQSGATYEWLDCDNFGTPIPGETNQTFTPTLSGNYAVYVDLNGCEDTSACEQIYLSLNDNTQNALALYPNPAAGEFQVILNTPAGKIKIYTSAGSVVYDEQVTSPHTTINLGSMTGVFMVELILPNNEIIREKLIIQ